MMEQNSSPEQPTERPFINSQQLIEPINSASVGGTSGEITAPGGVPESPGEPPVQPSIEPPTGPLIEPPAEARSEAPSEAPQSALAAAGFVVPRNLARLLDENLIPSGLPGNETDKYNVRNYPGLLVRHDTEAQPEEFIAAHDATMRLTDYGIDVLPHDRLIHNGRAYAVTAKVAGESVHDLLRNNPDELLLNNVDALFGKIGKALLSETQEGRPVAMDAMDARQYMRGVIATQPEQKLWLVDVPASVGAEQDYAFNVLQLTNGVLDAEQDTGFQLTAGRLALMDAIDHLPSVSRDARQVADLALQALETNTPIDFDDVPYLR